VVGGIGFIGAGVIMHRGATVQGVTTAATLWAAASVGVAAGLGQYTLASVLTGSIFVVQIIMRRVEWMILRARRGTAPGRFELRVDCEGESYPIVSDILARRQDLTVVRRSVQRGAEQLAFRAVIRTHHASDLTGLEEELVNVQGVRKVDLWHLGIEDD
jgi:putative Mg2+ transporter-C (MgtC) family protein